MPGFDRSGPMGQGSRTGRGMGYCTGYAQPGYGAGYGGAGFGRGRRGRGGGFRHRWFQNQGAPFSGGWAPMPAAAPNPEDERRALRDQAEALRRQLNEIDKRLAALTPASAE